MKNKLLIGLAILSVTTFINTKAHAVNFYDTIGTNYEGPVERLSELEIISGVSDHTYNAERTVTRAEFAKILMGAALKKSEFNALTIDDASVQFSDLDKEAWYYPYVVCAVNGGFMSGYEDGTFKPNRDISYEEISKMVTKALGHGYLTPNDPRGWQAEYVDKMYEYNLFDGMTAYDSIHDKANRGNVAVIVWNMLTTDTWKMIYRNDTSGFTYINSNQSLMSQKILDHTCLIDAHIDGFQEVNGGLNIILNGRSYRLFDQTTDMYFSMIGGETDVLLKRVEYPGKIIEYEVIGVSPDIGATLITGTYDQVKEEGYDLTNKTKLSKGADFYYVYTNKSNDIKDRVVSVNLNDFYLIETVKIDDQKEKEAKERDKSHTDIPSDFADDTIAYRYKTNIDELTRVININEDIEITNGAVLFKNNKKVNWTTLKKGDLLVEVQKDRYYFIVTTTPKTARLEKCDVKKGEHKIYTSVGEFETYDSTLFYDYKGETPRTLSRLSDSKLKELVGKNVELAVDETGRVVRVELLEGEVKLEELHIGVYDDFEFLGKSSEYNEITLYMDGKRKTYRTSMKSPNTDKGDLVKISFNEKAKSIVTGITVVNNDTKLTDNLKIKQYKYIDLKNKIKYYDEDKILINRIKYSYEFGKYDAPKSFEIKQVSIQELLNYDDDANVKTSAIVDNQDGVVQVFMQDYSEKDTRYYGLLTKVYEKEKKQYVQISQVNGNKDTYIVQGPCNVETGDFVVFEVVDKETIKLGEKYTPKVLGYFKDLTVEDKIMDNRKVLGYSLNEGGELDIAEWTISSKKESYDLSNYDIFLIILAKNAGTAEYTFTRASLVSKNNISLEIGDKIAIDEIDGAIVIYRGYKEN